MDKQLLEEFVIKEIGDNLIIFATDKAYELLGFTEKQIVLNNGINKDAIEEIYYKEAFVFYLFKRYRIDGLVRVSNGNSHDANWEKEVLIFNKGNVWSEDLNEYRSQESSAYVDAPIIIDKEEFTEDMIQNWIKKYDLSGNGEGRRLIYCSNKNNSAKFLFSFKKSYSLHTPLSLYINSDDKNIYTGSSIYLAKKEFELKK